MPCSPVSSTSSPTTCRQTSSRAAVSTCRAGWRRCRRGFIWQISFSPYASDYSRYLPADIGIARPFFSTYLGATLGTILSFTFGAVAVLATPEGTGAMAAVKQSTGCLGPILMVLFLLNIISHNALNLYGAVLSIITSIQTFASQWTPTIKVRVVLSSGMLAGCCFVALGASADFISQFIGLILALLLLLVPWVSINLIDFYLIKHGSYDIASIFRATAGFTGGAICMRSLRISSGLLCSCRLPIRRCMSGRMPIWWKGLICRGWWGWW